jgi:hypothetical protein
MKNRPWDRIALGLLETVLRDMTGCGDEAGPLSRLLAYAMNREPLFYQDVKDVVQDDAEEILLLASEWRLLLPVRTRKSSSWEDRLLVMQAGELYEIPNIVRSLAAQSLTSGTWNTETAVYEFFKESGHPFYNRMPRVVRCIFEEAANHRITADQIKMICSRFGLSGMVDSLIADLKAAGIMSPKLESMPEVLRQGSPVYELNPAVGAGLPRQGCV